VHKRPSKADEDDALTMTIERTRANNFDSEGVATMILDRFRPDERSRYPGKRALDWANSYDDGSPAMVDLLARYGIRE